MNSEFVSVEIAEIESKKEQLENEFDFDGYQVVRRELFAHLRDPAVTIRRDSITFNNSCIIGLEDAVYILVLINPNTKRLLIRKCDEDDKNALRWCVAKEDSRKSRQIKSREFSERLFYLLGWDKRNRYKVLGYRIKYEGEEMYIFDLLETEVFDDTKRKDPKFAEELAKLNALDKTEEVKKAFSSDRIMTTFGKPIEENQLALDISNISDFSTEDNLQIGEYNGQGE